MTRRTIVEHDGVRYVRSGFTEWPEGTPEPGQVGHLGRYWSPYGELPGLRARVRKWCESLRMDKSLPWVGLGIVADLEAVLQILDLREFAEWLRVQPGPHADYAQEILDALEAGEDLDDLRVHIINELGKPAVGETYHAAITEAAAAGETIGDIRGVLIELGMLAEGDNETELAPLLRALLA